MILKGNFMIKQKNVLKKNTTGIIEENKLWDPKIELILKKSLFFYIYFFFP